MYIYTLLLLMNLRYALLPGVVVDSGGGRGGVGDINGMTKCLEEIEEI